MHRASERRDRALDRLDRGPAEDARKLVLLIEDNPDDREMYGGLLWYNGYDVLPAPDGESGVAAALEVRPDLILLDIGLPGRLSGLDVARRLREEGLGVPVIALSAFPREELGSAMEEGGVSAYLEKPIDPFAVVREVMQRIGGAQPRGGT